MIPEDPEVIFGGEASESAGGLLGERTAIEVVSEYAVSPIVMAGPPGERVCEPIMYWVEGLGVIVVEERVRIGRIAMGVPDAGVDSVGLVFGALVVVIWLLACWGLVYCSLLTT